MQAKQDLQVGSNSSLYSDTKRWKFLKQKKLKSSKRAHIFKGFASSYNVDILNYSNPEIQLEDTESAFKKKLINLLTHWKGFKFATTIVSALISIFQFHSRI